jgi:unsaturated rhamnogalacturonyl hydrolase
MRVHVVGLAVVATLVAGGTAQAAGAPPVPTPTRAEVLDTLTRVDAYWLAHGSNLAPPDWRNGAFHVGNLAMVTATGVSNHQTLPWAQNNRYQLPTDPTRPPAAEDIAAGEAYLALWRFHQAPGGLDALRTKLHAATAAVATGDTSLFDHVEALHAAMPSFARIAAMDNDPTLLSTMDTLFRAARGRLFSERHALWWRDASFARTRIFWSRGNGMAMAALAKVIAVLPRTDPRWASYVEVLGRMALAVRAVQRPDGFWNADLGRRNPAFAGPETSGTAFITFALVKGINLGVLPAGIYRPVVLRAWHGLTTTAMTPDGLLGYVQGEAIQPSDAQPVAATDMTAYGTGAFLQAGAELATLVTAPAAEVVP